MIHRQILTGLIAIVLLAGCLVRLDDQTTHAEQKSIGVLLDDMFRGMVKVTDELEKISSLLNKVSAKPLTAAEVKQLGYAIIRGGSKAIDQFKLHTFNDMLALYKKVVPTNKRLEAAINGMSSKEQKAFNKLVAADNIPAAATYLKENTHLGRDRIFSRHVKMHSIVLEDMAEVVADNHRLADAIAHTLVNDSMFRELGIKADELAAELKLGAQDINLSSGGTAFTEFISHKTKIVEEMTGIDLWHEHASLELMLRRADDGKPIYTKITDAEDISYLARAFDKEFTDPVIGLEPRHRFITKMYAPKVYDPARSRQAASSFLEKFLARFPKDD